MLGTDANGAAVGADLTAAGPARRLIAELAAADLKLRGATA